MAMTNHLRYRHARDEADGLGQIFTPAAVADLLVNSLPQPSKEAGGIIDFGAGHGALTWAALRRFPKSNALLIEVDPRCVNILNSTRPQTVKVIEGDVFDSELGDVARIALSNPPYGMLPVTESISSLLSKMTVPLPTNGGWVRGDAAFVAKAWMCSERGSSIGLIVASPLVREHSFRRLREMLVNQLQGLCVTQLDTHVFHGAEVQAFLITGRRALSRKRNVILRKASIDGTITDEIEIGWNAAVNRLDFDYYKAMEKIGASSALATDTLASVGARITRGSRSHNEFQKMGLDAFHTTDFKEFSGELKLLGHPEKYQLARSGDILIPRVGTRCLLNQAKVIKGAGLFTDCVYRLSVEKKASERVWKTLASTFGAEWRLANASGNCAKHLTVQTLLGMPLVS